MTWTYAFFIFLLFSFIGWFYETTVCGMIYNKQFKNKGILYGPYCPIYGVGAILCYLIFSRIDNIFIFFLCACCLCSLVEYISGTMLEHFFHNRWWDYSHFPLNIHGHVCIYAALFFGIANVTICKFIIPHFLSFLLLHDLHFLHLIASFLLTIIALDIILSIIYLREMNRTITILYYLLSESTNRSLGRISDILIKKPYQIIKDKDTYLKLIRIFYKYKHKNKYY
ncbi:putative ABC transporter permease [Eggerthia catenaformis]